MKRIAIVYIDAGGGHRATAQALVEMFRREGRPWQVDLVNADDVLDPADPPLRLLGVRTNDIYNLLLRNGWTFGTRELLPLVHAACRWMHPRQVRLLRPKWRELRADLVLSAIPHLNRALFESLRAEWPRVPFVTLLTDLADYPPRFWIEPQRQHYVCGSAYAVEQARSVAPQAEVWPVSGMVIHPRFYDPMEEDHGAARRALHLDADRPTGLVMFGAYGSKAMAGIARELARAGTSAQWIFLCGRNTKLLERLRAMELPYPIHCEGFTNEIARFMWMSDFFVGKPGSGSISEALHMGLPVLVKHGVATIVQERWNVPWLEASGMGMAWRRPRDLPPLVTRLLQAEQLETMRRNVRAYEIRAVFEVPAILERILLAAEHGEGAAAQNGRPGDPPGESAQRRAGAHG